MLSLQYRVGRSDRVDPHGEAQATGEAWIGDVGARRLIPGRHAVEHEITAKNNETIHEWLEKYFFRQEWYKFELTTKSLLPFCVEIYDARQPPFVGWSWIVVVDWKRAAVVQLDFNR